MFEHKQNELDKYKKLILATIDYHIISVSNNDAMKKIYETNFSEVTLKLEDFYKKGNLSILKRWFRDFTEGIIESRDLKFNRYINEKTNNEYNIDVFKSYNERVDKIIEKGKITTDNQFYDLNILINELCQAQSIDRVKIEKLNKLILEYETKKVKKNNTKK